MATGSQKEPLWLLSSSPTARFEGKRVAKRFEDGIKFGFVIGPVDGGASVSSADGPLLWHVKYDDGDDDYMPESDVTECMQIWIMMDCLQNGQHKAAAAAQQRQNRQERGEAPDIETQPRSNKRRKKRGFAKSPPDNSLAIDLTLDDDDTDHNDASSRGDASTGEKKNHASTAQPEYVASSHQDSPNSSRMASEGATAIHELKARSNVCKVEEGHHHQDLFDPIADPQIINPDNEAVLSNPNVLLPDSTKAAKRTMHSTIKKDTNQPEAMDVLLLHQANIICKGSRHPGNQVFHEMAETIYDENIPTDSAEKWQLAWDILVEWKRRYPDSRFLRIKKSQIEYSKLLSPAEERSAVLCYMCHLEKTADERLAKKEAMIVTPRNEDVISVSNLHGVEHPGNMRLRDLCVSHIEEYEEAPIGCKQDVSQKIIAMLSNDGVRFLKENRNGMWYIMSNKRACKLVSEWIRRQGAILDQALIECASAKSQRQIQKAAESKMWDEPTIDDAEIESDEGKDEDEEPDVTDDDQLTIKTADKKITKRKQKQQEGRETNYSPTQLRKLYDEIKASHDKLFIIKRREPNKTMEDWHVVQISWNETNHARALKLGEYYVRFYVRNVTDAKKRLVSNCRYWPLIHEIRQDGYFGQMISVRPSKVNEVLEHNPSTRGWYELEMNISEDGLVGPFNFVTSQEGNATETHRISDMIWNTLEEEVRTEETTVDISDLRKIQPFE